MVVPPLTPPLPRMVTNPEVEDSIVYYYHELLPDDSGDGRSASYSCVLMGYSNRQTTVHLYELQDWCWVLRASAAAQLRVSPPRSKIVLVDENRFYMLSTINKILVCDFQSSSISAMELPDGVEEGHTGRIMLSRGEGSGIYLIHVEESHLRVFRSDNMGSCWTLENHISLQELRTTLGIADRPPVEGNGAGVKIHAVGDNARFVFLEIHGAVVFLDTTSKQANKIYEMTPEDKELVGVHPLTLKCLHVFLRFA